MRSISLSNIELGSGAPTSSPIAPSLYLDVDSGIFYFKADGQAWTTVDASIDGLTSTVAELNAVDVSAANVARTATADGLTTGTIADGKMLNFITVTSADANNIIVLPTPTPGVHVWLQNGATGYELRSNAPASVGINGGTSAAAESAIGASTTVHVFCVSATNWIGEQFTAAGVKSAVQVAAD